MYKVSNVRPLVDQNFSGTYLLLINPEKIPHLVLIHQELYFTLTNTSADIGIPFQTYFKKLKRAKKKLLFFELKNTETDFMTVFSKYKKVDTESTTCLIPVKESILPNSTANFIFELIPELVQKKLVANIYHLHLEDLLNELGQFNLTTYSQNDIFNYIKHLNKKND